MPTLVVTGGRRLRGEVNVSGSRNAALPLLAASLLARGRSHLRQVPAITDVEAFKATLSDLGVIVNPGPMPGSLVVDTAPVATFDVSYERVLALRACVLLLGPLLARYGHARVALPGGSNLGDRPMDQHLKGLACLGATLRIERGVIVAQGPRLRGAAFAFDVVTVTGTETLMMAAALAQGRTILENAACEPEVEELARVLNKMGARVHGAGTALITIEGVATLQPLDHAVMPDRIEAGSWLIAAAMTRGHVLVRGCDPEHLGAVLTQLCAMGVDLAVEGDGVRVRGPAVFDTADIGTRPFPGFPTDLQPPFMALLTLANGPSVFTETVFEHRYQHVAELRRLGADIAIEGRRAVVRGPARLQGAPVAAHDLRGAAALVLAGLAAQGTTTISGVHHLDRGYERWEKKLRGLGANIRRKNDNKQDNATDAAGRSAS